MSPKGLLIDWGGVLTSDVFASFDHWCEREGRAAGSVATMFAEEPGRGLLFDLECGRIGIGEFETSLGVVLDTEPTGLADALFAGMTTQDPRMADAVSALHAAGVRTGLLSNSWGMHHYDRTRWAEMFDVLVLSAEHGVRKPDRAIYEAAVDAIGLLGDQLVFVDDIGGNLKPARELGMLTYRHTSVEDTVAFLGEQFGVAL
ncbi:MAG TPA: HAD family phosphatase [Sporichthyaceae bacterium]|nr:HAD family phosphatase [Sporichthyaceae bacterium]